MNFISKRMMNTKLKSPFDVCSDCSYYKKNENNEITLGELRWHCQYCKSFGQGGIYKGDLVIAAMQSKKQNTNLTPGRKPTHLKIYGHAVKELLNKGESLRSISNILGISVNTVQKIKSQLEKN